MAKNNLTIFQKLGQVLGPDSAKLKNRQPQLQRFNMGSDVLLKTQSKEEYEMAKLQAQQNKYLAQMWKKVENGLFQQSINYETTRIGSYADFEAMEFYPIIAAALDIFMEECLAGSTIIPLLNGENVTIEELYDKKINDFWVYGVDLDENKIKSSKIEKVIYKGVKPVYNITLDDGTVLKSTDNHKWLTSDNKWVETKDLIFGSSLKSISKKLNYKGYEKVSLTNFKKDGNFTHIIVAETELLDKKQDLLKNPKIEKQKIVIHHKSFDKLNNEPSQLQYMFWDDHQKLHTDLNKKRWENEDFSNKMRKIFSETGRKTWEKSNKKEVVARLQNGLKTKLSKLSDEEKKIFLNRGGVHNGMYGSKRFGKLNPNYNFSKNHIENINEEEYVKFVISIKGNRVNQLMDKFNLLENTVIEYNNFLCKKYFVKRIEHLDFYFNEGFDIQKIKDFISTENKPELKTLKYCKKYNIKPFKLRSFLTTKGYKNWTDVVKTIGNHRVISVEYVGEEKVYDLVNSSVSHNFAVKCNNGMVISHNCTTLNTKGKVLNVYSDSSRVKGILEDLFFNRLDIHVSLPMWTRNTAKYGDNFVFLNIDEKHGIIGAKQMPNYEMERRESGLFDMISGRDLSSSNVPKSDKVKFYWRGRDIEFNSWQIAHFRLLGDDRRLPYGTSLLEKARRIWKQLILSEDAMLVYRVTRAPERRVYKIYVGNIDDADVPAYVNEIADRFKRTPIIDSNTGQMDLRYNQMPVWKNTPIPLLDGRTLTIEDLAREYEDKKINHVYSIKDETNELVNGKVIWCGKNYTATRMVKITLEDNSYFVTAEEHPFILKNGDTKRADELKESDSLMPFNFDSLGENIGKKNDTHILKNIDFIDGDDVYCMTVVGENGEEDRHNFAALAFNGDGSTSQSGVFVKNSNDQDYFIPVRSEDAPNPIDTLPGASNLNDIADLEYLRNNLFTSLRVPKPFLGFDESSGEGKNLALQDIRFSRTINRIQQSMLQELNKIAIIHLYLLGFEEDFDNFTLTLNNPSTQAEMLKVEHLQTKVTLYKDAVSDAGNGFAAMSMTRGKREILNMSDDEIKKDILEQRMEKAAAAELANSASVIKHTGMFDVVDRVYGDMKTALQGGSGEGGGESGGGESGGGGLGGSFGGGGSLPSLGGEESGEESPLPLGGEEGEEAGGAEETPGAETGGAEETPGAELTEKIKRVDKLLKENKEVLQEKLDIRRKKYKNIFVNRLLESFDGKSIEKVDNTKIYDKNVKFNSDIDEIIKGIDKMLDE